MSGNTITQPATPAVSTKPTPSTVAPVPAGATGATVSQSRAARELVLKRGEFDLAVQLGCVRTIVDDGGGGSRVARSEIDRLRGEQGFPEMLRERVKAVGTTAGAELLEVTTAKFTRFARLGLIAPVRFYLNRYRAVVWLYLAEELRQFKADEKNTHLLKGRIPEELRKRLDAGLDLRPRNWRGRHLGFLLRQTEDPWARAAASASLLDPLQVAEIVRDPYERAYLNRHRPARADQATPESPAARITASIMTADDPDEIEWLRADVRQSLAEARTRRAAPRPGGEKPRPPGKARSAHDTRHETRLVVAARPAPHLPNSEPRPEERRPHGALRPAPDLPNGVRRPERHRPTTHDAPERRGLLGWLRRRHP
ncbi:hypothetical protein SGFS_019880 [Streptomyces graminofaciens]|uniref:Uncharacterized protein n=1 Tax=Streptomyces graminofaciens TaxID=68212 RepID=A0ABN5VBP6_9ACTN|nr:DUF6397 family protein [Streptomyces graminofaciens]BBC30694.1 hypothetical protein SGFS_019880 [Streptomyces graminofaciens]